MTEPIRLATPLTDADVEQLHIGDRVLLNGVAPAQAHPA